MTERSQGTITRSTSHAGPLDYDVLIVGCGPAGATLANFLRRYGCKAAIFDRDNDVFFAPRATGLDDQSLRIYQSLGFFDRLVKEGHVRQGALWFKDHNGRTLMSLDRMSIGEDLLVSKNGHFAMNFFDQPGVERILREDFEKPGGADPYLAHEVLSVRDCDTHTELVAKDLETRKEHLFRASYIIGCDGGRSLVRRSLDVERLDLGYSEEYLVIDAVVDDEVYWRTRIPDGGVVTLDPTHSGVFAKGVHGFVRFDCLRHPDVVGDKLETQKDFEEAGRAVIIARGHDPEKFRAVRYAPYTFYAGMPAKWRVGRLLVAGDAAHQTPPWAGQGFNMCMRDAANLSFKLALVLSGRASETLLDTYAQERQPDSIRRIKGAVKTGKMMQTKSRWKKVSRSLSFFLHRHSRFIRRAMFRSMLRRRPYEAGLVGKNHKLAGSIMPQPTVADISGTERRLDDLFGVGFGLIAATSPNGVFVERFVKDLQGVVVQLGPDIRDPTGALTKWFTQNKVAAVLVRPDRYIYDMGNDADEICRSLFAELNAPADLHGNHHHPQYKEQKRCPIRSNK